MAAKKDPASAVVAFFETASLETAQTVFAICKGVLARRMPAKTKPRVPKAPNMRAVAAPAANNSADNYKPGA